VGELELEENISRSWLALGCTSSTRAVDAANAASGRSAPGDPRRESSRQFSQRQPDPGPPPPSPSTSTW
jgi:hypothetical protein